MSLPSRLLSAAGGGVDKLYIDDLFQAFTRTGTGASATITTGINLSAKGGMIWSKGRSGATDHALYDTSRGATFDLASNLTSAQTTQAQGLTAFGTTGHTWGTLAKVNTNAATYVDYVFAKAPKFFDVVTYTGNGANRAIAHSLGQEVGMILIKRTDATANWQVYHRSLANTEYMVLNTTAAKATGATRWNSTTPTTSVFSVGTDASVNDSGGTYVAYLFAHDTSTDGIIQCGSVTGAGAVEVNLGWEPQYVLIKCSTDSSGDWEVFDTSRGMPVDNALTGAGSGAVGDRRLRPNSSLAEDGLYAIEPTATGFKYIKFGNTQTFVYLAIRRPNKPPTTGTQVYNATARTGTGATPVDIAVGFSPDLVSVFNRGSGQYCTWVDRLRGASPQLFTGSSGAESVGYSGLTQFLPTGVTIFDAPGAADMNQLGYEYINHFFKRAPGFFDVVCSTSSSNGNLEFSHGLAAVPELIIHRDRGFASDWDVWTKHAGAWLRLKLNTNAAQISGTPSTVTDSYFFSESGSQSSSSPQVCYLFATKTGISKVGSYTGNGSSQTINCGFTTGARFILIKRIDSTGDWYVWDTARGIVSADDPHLSLNTTNAEVTTNDSVDPDSTGFIVNQVAATNINVSSATYLFLAIA